jgi:hypothetical protein
MQLLDGIGHLALSIERYEATNASFNPGVENPESAVSSHMRSLLPTPDMALGRSLLVTFLPDSKCGTKIG